MSGSSLNPAEGKGGRCYNLTLLSFTLSLSTHTVTAPLTVITQSLPHSPCAQLWFGEWSGKARPATPRPLPPCTLQHVGGVSPGPASVPHPPTLCRLQLVDSTRSAYTSCLAIV
ncbi:hypothetical protein E2C01_021874 [Portunus trituberculatus]|uniref:Uncharacterized protein n=1 Tax=Portunus trituberculatus TaxID=210409 RepID=A0A5B7E5S5_PORTR|nr:hypothetical protein [Portunus trituberculatus]